MFQSLLHIPRIGPSAASFAKAVRSLPEYPSVILRMGRKKEQIIFIFADLKFPCKKKVTSSLPLLSSRKLCNLKCRTNRVKEGTGVEDIGKKRHI